MSKDVSRRRFLETIAAGTAAGAGLSLVTEPGGAAPRTLPKRVLGRTGASVSILVFGCGSRFLMYEDENGHAEIGRAHV